MKVSLATIVRGRRGHLANQATGIAAQADRPDEWVIVGMNEEPPTEAAVPSGVRIVPGRCDDPETPLPLAAARNLAASLAGGDLLIFLDVDCIPDPSLVAAYRDAATREDRLWMGQVRYLREGACDGDWDFERLRALGKANRLQPAELVEPTASERYELFWSLNYAISRDSLQRIEGYDEGYRGYGGEDTDFAFAARAAGVPFGFAPAVTYHQHHESHDPPLKHVASIVQNARRFQSKWGIWPMEKWLREFDRRGLVHFDPGAGRLEELS